MDLERHIAALETNAETIARLVRMAAEEQARWKPSPNEWSILEVVNHLYDEEREDFRTRVDLTLHQPGQTLPPIDPEGWVTARRYNERDPGESLERFLVERRQSLAWLRTLRDPDWNRLANHPRLKGIRAGDFMVSWVAHDLLHLRQLVELHWKYLAQQAAPFKLRYAGDW